MNLEELKTRERELKASGDYLLTHALERGRQGNPHYVPNNKTLEAYRTGLDLYFREGGWMIPLEQVLQEGNISLQQGFFDKFYQWYGIIRDDESRHLLQDSYQSTVKQLAVFFRKGRIPEQDYMSYINGSLVALDVWQARIEKFRQGPFLHLPKMSEVEKTERVMRELSLFNEWLDTIHSERRELFDRLENPTTYDTLNIFSTAELQKLELYRWLREHGKL